ncbi:MAG: 2-dehydropantoate 2-reductase N-terminal domain-containing protein [Dysgonomonas sp.]|nr:2-dehydropantoate 2-reductase N-terminal domain-containing protein [Dysgonomonas sp.]
MKILIYGAGVIGCTYGWLLSKAGCDITVLVRPEKKENIEKNGINIHCTDFRGGKKHIDEIIFFPKVTDALSSDNDFEYIIVATNNLYLKNILPSLKKGAGKAHILFFQNVWVDEFGEIAKFLAPHQYFFGFPFMVGGGRDKTGIKCAISGLKNAQTLLGELNDKLTPRIQKLYKCLSDAGLKPFVSPQIKVWLVTHYTLAAGLSAGIMKAGSAANFSKDSKILKESVKAIREGLNICAKLGIDPKAENANKPYYIPLFILIPILKIVYRNEALTIMFDGHTKHSPDEMKKMLDDIIKKGKENGVEIPYLINMYNSTFR